MSDIIDKDIIEKLVTFRNYILRCRIIEILLDRCVLPTSSFGELYDISYNITENLKRWVSSKELYLLHEFARRACS